VTQVGGRPRILSKNVELAVLSKCVLLHVVDDAGTLT
jgi:hypothetical protein